MKVHVVSLQLMMHGLLWLILTISLIFQDGLRRLSGNEYVFSKSKPLFLNFPLHVWFIFLDASDKELQAH